MSIPVLIIIWIFNCVLWALNSYALGLGFSNKSTQVSAIIMSVISAIIVIMFIFIGHSLITCFMIYSFMIVLLFYIITLIIRPKRKGN